MGVGQSKESDDGNAVSDDKTNDDSKASASPAGDGAPEDTFTRALVKAARTGNLRALAQQPPHIIAAVCTRSGDRLIHEAVRRGQVAVVQELSYLPGAGVKSQNSFTGDTALHLAAQLGDMDMVQCVTRHGGSAILKNHRGLTAAQLARQAGHTEVAEFLDREERSQARGPAIIAKRDPEQFPARFTSGPMIAPGTLRKLRGAAAQDEETPRAGQGAGMPAPDVEAAEADAPKVDAVEGVAHAEVDAPEVDAAVESVEAVADVAAVAELVDLPAEPAGPAGPVVPEVDAAVAVPAEPEVDAAVGKVAKLARAAQAGPDEVRRLCESGTDIDEVDEAGFTAVMRVTSHGLGTAMLVLLEQGASLDILVEESGDHAVHLAARGGYKNCLEVLVMCGSRGEQGVINARNKDGDTPLHLAAAGGHRKVVSYCLLSGGLVGIRNKAGLTPAMVAIEHDQAGCAQLIAQGGGAQADVLSESGEPAAVMATRLGRWGCLQALQRGGAALTARDKHGHTCAMIAAQYDHQRCLQLALSSGCEIDEISADGSTAVMLAARAGMVASLMYLIRAGADVNLVDKKQRSALMLACAGGHAECMRVLCGSFAYIDKVDEDGLSVAHYAARVGKLECSRILGYDFDVGARDKMGNTPAHYAAKGGHSEVLQSLLSLEADPAAVNAEGYTPRQLAEKECPADKLPGIQRLLPGPDEVEDDETAKQHITDLLEAAKQGTAEDMERLLPLVGPNVADEGGFTPLHYVSQSGSVQCLDMLIAAGADLNAMSKQHELTPVHCACMKSGVPILRRLAEVKARMHVPDNHGNTPSHLAAQNGHAPCVSYMLSLEGVDPNSPNEYLDTVLHKSAEGGHINSVVACLEHGADVTLLNCEGSSALQLATTENHVDVKQLLGEVFPQPTEEAGPRDAKRLLFSLQSAVAAFQANTSSVRARCVLIDSMDQLRHSLVMQLPRTAAETYTSALAAAKQRVHAKVDQCFSGEASKDDVRVAAAQRLAVATAGIAEGSLALQLASASCPAAELDRLRAVVEQLRLVQQDSRELQVALANLHKEEHNMQVAAVALKQAELAGADLADHQQALDQATAQLAQLELKLDSFRAHFPEVECHIEEPIPADVQAELRTMGLMTAVDMDHEYLGIARFMEGNTEVRKAIHRATGTLRALVTVDAKHLEGEVVMPHGFSHPAIVTVDRIFVHKRRLFKESYWYDMNAGTWLSRRRGVPECAVVVHDLLLGLSYLHDEAQVVHNNLNLKAILITDECRAKICDWRHCQHRDSAGLPAPSVDLIPLGGVVLHMCGQLTPTTEPEVELLKELQLIAHRCTAEEGWTAKALLADLKHIPTAHTLPKPAIRRTNSLQQVRVVGEVWEWLDGDGVWRPYPPVEHAKLEAAYSTLHRSSPDTHEVLASPLMRSPRAWSPQPEGSERLHAATRITNVQLSEGRIVRLWGNSEGQEMREFVGRHESPVCAVRRRTRSKLPLPLHWDTQLDDVAVLPVALDCKEAEQVEKLLHDSLPAARLVGLQRVQNTLQWHSYSNAKMLLEYRRGQCTERHLWHGSGSTDPLVVVSSAEGVDFRLGRGGWYGKGSYFARTAAYSDSAFAYRAAGGSRQLILAKVLCGREYSFGARVDSGTQALVRPPPDYDSVTAGPHSMRGHSARSMIHVVYDRAYVYPAYVVTYQLAAAAPAAGAGSP